MKKAFPYLYLATLLIILAISITSVVWASNRLLDNIEKDLHNASIDCIETK